MKHLFTYQLFTTVVKVGVMSCWLAFNACTPLDIQRKTKLITKEVNILSAEELNALGEILDIGDPLTNHGHCWATTSQPTIADARSSLGAPAQRGVFTTNITNLKPDTKYYVRAYVQLGDTVLYGDDISVVTPETTPPPVTTGISNISKSEATARGTITSTGKNTITQHGHCWSSTPLPTIDDHKTSNGQAKNTGNFSSTLTNLQANTLYYVRTYAQSVGGITYGNQTSFKTPKN